MDCYLIIFFKAPSVKPFDPNSLFLQFILVLLWSIVHTFAYSLLLHSFNGGKKKFVPRKLEDCYFSSWSADTILNAYQFKALMIVELRKWVSMSNLKFHSDQARRWAEVLNWYYLLLGTCNAIQDEQREWIPASKCSQHFRCHTVTFIISGK